MYTIEKILQSSPNTVFQCVGKITKIHSDVIDEKNYMFLTYEIDGDTYEIKNDNFIILKNDNVVDHIYLNERVKVSQDGITIFESKSFN